MSDSSHWEAIYTGRSPEELGWHRPHLERSLGFLQQSGALDRIVDVGGGASTLVDDLIARGHQKLAVIDLAASALEATKARLGKNARHVDWIVGDITTPLLPDASVDFWHDRAVFHFLLAEAARDAYLEQVLRCLKPGGHCVVATFAPDGPERCSGLPVARYDAEGLHRVFGDAFEKVASAGELHQTPAGVQQSFTYCFFRRR